MSVHTRRRAPMAVLLGLLLCASLLAVGSGLTAAHAVPPTPNVHQPATGTGIPSVTWDRVPQTTTTEVKYEAKLLNQSGIQLETSGLTVNNSWTPTIQVPTGTPLTFEVQTVVGSERSPVAAVQTERAPTTFPSLVSPANGAQLFEPGDPLVFRWEPVAGAHNYTVETAPAENFDSVDPAQIQAVDVSTTSYAPNVIPTPGTRYWRVIANFDAAKNVRSTPSTVRWYHITTVIRSGESETLPLLPVSPTHGSTTTVTDVEFAWHPIDGAVKYALQYGTEPDFTNAKTVSDIKSTRYSPSTTLANNQYYWRVAPVFANNVDLTSVWDDMQVWQFQRQWPQQPDLVYPASGATVGDPFYYQWEPVRWASRYRLQVSPNSSFTPLSSVDTCETRLTTYAPYKRPGNDDCWPNAAGTHYWRVVAYDDPAQVETEIPSAEVHWFNYDPERVTLLSPANGAQVQVPTLTWAMLEGAGKYRVKVSEVGSTTSYSKDTYATSWTPETLLGVGKTYRWDVTPVYDNGRIGASLLPESQRTFTVLASDPATATTPIPTGPGANGASGVRPPNLTWTPVTGANVTYRVNVRRVGTLGWQTLPDIFRYPTGTDSTGIVLDPGTYEWYVAPSVGSPTPAGSYGTFTMEALAETNGHVIALTGSDTLEPARPHCEPVAGGCADLRQTPVFTWDPVPGASQYKLYLAQDAGNTTKVYDPPLLVKNTMFAPPETLPDSEAGVAYFYRVVPCWTIGEDPLCSPLQPLEQQFSKVSHQVQLVTKNHTEQHPSIQDNDIRLDWDDYFCTLQGLAGCTLTNDDAGVQIELPVGASDTATSVRAHADVGVRQYRVQVSRDAANMGGTQESLAVVDQSFFTETGKTYPDGPLYWRVQAVDGSGRNLPWSPIRKVVKSSAVPQPTHGINNEEFPSEVVLEWSPAQFAKTYQVQIFQGSPANPDGVSPYASSPEGVGSTALQQTSWSPPVAFPQGQYSWRVRRFDVDGRAGGTWSSLETFRTRGAGVDLLGPSQGGTVPQRAATFSWNPTPGVQATRYRLNLKKGAGAWQPQLTSATTFAWKSSLLPDTYSWRVEALASNSSVIGTSVTRTFTVQQLTRPVQITGPGTVGSQMTLQLGSWNAAGTVTSYQWLRYSGAIPGATGPSYQLTANDDGAKISLRVTGRHPEYDEVAIVSNVIEAGKQLAVVNTVAPGVSGTKSLGTTLTANPGSWRLSDGSSLPRTPTYAYQWLRNGTPIAGATARTRVVSAADVGQALAVRVTAHVLPEYTSGTASSTGYRVAKVSSRTAMRLASNVVRFGVKPKATIVVSSAVTPTGTVRFYDGRKLIKTVRLTAGNRGRLVLSLPARPRGLRYLKARYVGNTQVTGSVSPKVRLRVR